MSPWLKAGLIGAVVMVVLDLVGLIPCVGVIACIVGLLAYIGIGALAAYWMPPLRTAGPAAGQGALAAGLASLISGIVNTVLFLIQTAVAGSARILSQIPAETLRQLEEAGVDRQILERFAGPGGALLAGSFCCAGGLILAAILGAIGGAVLAAMKSD